MDRTKAALLLAALLIAWGLLVAVGAFAWVVLRG